MATPQRLAERALRLTCVLAAPQTERSRSGAAASHQQSHRGQVRWPVIVHLSAGVVTLSCPMKLGAFPVVTTPGCVRIGAAVLMVRARRRQPRAG